VEIEGMNKRVKKKKGEDTCLRIKMRTDEWALTTMFFSTKIKDETL
jgi:hypothetical protein